MLVEITLVYDGMIISRLIFKDIEGELDKERDLIPFFLSTFQKFNLDVFKQKVHFFKGNKYGVAFHIANPLIAYVIFDMKEVKEIGIKNSMRLKLQEIVTLFQDKYEQSKITEDSNFLPLERDIERVFHNEIEIL